MVDRHRAHDRVVRAVQPARRRDAAALAARIRADRAATSLCRRAGRRRCRRTSGAPCWSAAPRAAGCWRSARCRRSNSCSRSSSIRPCRPGLLFFNGLREVDLRVRGFGHHIAALLASPAKAQMSRGGTRGAGARARGGGARERRRDPADDRADAHRGRERPRGRRRDRGTARSSARAQFVASSLNPHQTFLDLLDAGAGAARDPRAGRALPVQSAGAAVRAASQSARAAALRGERRASRSSRRPSW